MRLARVAMILAAAAGAAAGVGVYVWQGEAEDPVRGEPFAEVAKTGRLTAFSYWLLERFPILGTIG